MEQIYFKLWKQEFICSVRIMSVEELYKEASRLHG